MNITRARPRILTDVDVRADLGRLARVWEEEPTFALVPARTSVTPAWIEACMSQLPEAWGTRHFALLTSGSTGKPKLVIGDRERAEHLARLLHDLQSGETALTTVLTLPLTYCYAFVNQWLWSRVTHRLLVPTDGFGDVERLRTALAAAENAMLCMVGAQVPLVRRALPHEVFPGIVRLHFAGGAFPQDSLSFLAERFPNAVIYNNYGCAEAMPRLTLRLASAANDGANIGWPLPGVELVADSESRLQFRSPFSAVGFIDEDGLHCIGNDNWTATGDLGIPNGDGSWSLLGRTGEVFKRYGEKVSLAELSRAIGGVWSGEAVFYRESDPNGEQGAVLVVAPLPKEEELRAILRLLRQRFPRPHWPLRIEALDSLPVLPNRKVDQGRLGEKPGRTLWRQRF